LEPSRPLRLAKRAGLGISGALNGAITAAYLVDAARLSSVRSQWPPR
jgi:hypothetical protein